jgi:hypothetical protein
VIASDGSLAATFVNETYRTRPSPEAVAGAIEAAH